MLVTHMSDDVLIDRSRGLLTPSKKAQVELHLANCEPCLDRAANIQYWDGFMTQHTQDGVEDIGAE